MVDSSPCPDADALDDCRRAGLWGAVIPLAAIVVAALILRFWGLGKTSLWYDEVVTMRVAQTPSLAALIAALDQIDGTRAPLHPWILQVWLKVFGSSDLAGRSLSAVCGLGTVVVVYFLGRAAFDEATARWSAWLAAVCPPLVYYSREARMYAWLVLLTCLSWLVFFSFRHAVGLARVGFYGLLLVALVYSHPLGLFMVGAHAVAYLAARSSLRLSLTKWLVLQGAVALAIAPWIPRYFDHGTDYPLPRQTIRFLLAVPIEYVGGNSAVFAVCASIVAYGIVGRRPWRAWESKTENEILICWAALPPLAMFVYSHVSQSIFGPPRYHLFCAPAYLILLAHGLARLPAVLRWPLAAMGLFFSLTLVQSYEQALKADWRGLAGWIEATADLRPGASQPGGRVTLVIHPSDPRFPREQLEAARYYLGEHADVVPPDAPVGGPGEDVLERTYDVYCLVRPSAPEPAARDERAFYGIRVRRRGTVADVRFEAP
jgi:4-amino-4-deoxy-L-arabinose transferase-like glycosyltransferase